MSKDVLEQMREQVPSLEFLVSLNERLEDLPQDEITKLAMHYVGLAEKIVRKDLRFITEGQSSGQSGIVVTDVKAIRAKASFDVQTLARLLTGAGVGKQVNELRTKRLTVPEFGDALLGLARKAKDEVVKGMAKNLQTTLEVLEEVEDRVAQGGHPALDLKISRLAQAAWANTDIATNLFRSALVKNGIAHDPILDLVSNVRSPVRLQPTGMPKDPASKPKKSGGAGGKKGGDGSGTGSKGGSGTPEGSGGSGTPPKA